jgi:hypothetical protein
MPVFTHGQLYVALSRATNCENVYVSLSSLDRRPPLQRDPMLRMGRLQESDLVCLHLLQPNQNQNPSQWLRWRTTTELSPIPSVPHLRAPLLLLTTKIPKYIPPAYLTNCELFGTQETSLPTETEVDSAEGDVVPSKNNKRDRKPSGKKQENSK